MRNTSMFCKRAGLGTKGFTLVEMMVAVAVSGVIVVAISALYVVQQKSYVVQEQVAETQQNLRGAMLRLLDEIRQAGCDPTELAGAGILQATATRFQFTADIVEDIVGSSVNPNEADGGVFGANENVTFGLNAADDVDDNGIVDGGVVGADWSTSGSLRRDTGGGLQPMADLIDAVEFNYILDDGTSTTTPVNFNTIRVVQVSLLARGARPDPDGKYVDRSTYTTASGVVWDPPDDNFRRRFVMFSIQCRNMGY